MFDNILSTTTNTIKETLNGPVITPYEFVEIVEFYYLNNNGSTTQFKNLKDFQNKFQQLIALDSIPKTMKFDQMQYYKKQIRYIPKVQSYPSINNPIGVLNSVCSVAHKAVSQCSALLNKFNSNSSWEEYTMFANKADAVNIGAWSGLGTMADDFITNLVFSFSNKYTDMITDTLLDTLPLRAKPIILLSEQYNVNSTVSSEEVVFGSDFDKYEQKNSNMTKVFQTKTAQQNVSHVRNETLNITLFSTTDNLLLNWLDTKLKKWLLASDTDEGHYSYHYIKDGSLFLKDYSLQIIREDQFTQKQSDENYKAIPPFEQIGDYYVARCCIVKDKEDMNTARVRYLFDYESKKTKMMGLKLLGYNYTTDTRGDGVSVQLSFERSVNAIYNYLLNIRTLTESGSTYKKKDKKPEAPTVESNDSPTKKVEVLK